MAISFIAVSISDEATKNVGPKPTGTVEDDVMLAHVWAYEETVTSAPSGWSLLEQATTSDVEGEPEIFNSYLYMKIAGTSEPDDYTWVTTTDTGPTPNRRVQIVSYRGCLLSGPSSEDRSTHTENAGSDTLTFPDCSTGAAGRRQVALAAVGTTMPTATMGSPWTQRLDDDGQFVFDRILTATGSTGTADLTLPSAMTSWGFTAILVPDPPPFGDRDYCQGVDTQIN